MNELWVLISSFFLSVVHCRCSKCYSVPVRKRVRKRTPTVTLLSLPEEVLLCVFQCLSAEDLLSVRAVSKHTVHTVALLHNFWHVCAPSPRICSGSSSCDHLIWWVRCCFCWGTKWLDLCYRFTPSCGTLLTTIPVYGPGSVSETHGRPPTAYGYLKGEVSSVKKRKEKSMCFSIVWILTWNLCLLSERQKRGILKQLWN